MECQPLRSTRAKTSDLGGSHCPCPCLNTHVQMSVTYFVPPMTKEILTMFRITLMTPKQIELGEYLHGNRFSARGSVIGSRHMP